MKRKWLKSALCVISAAVILILVINFTVPEKLIQLRIDSAEPNRIEYTIVSWSIRPITTGFLEENTILFQKVNGEWISTRTGDYLRHDIGISMRPFCRKSAEYVPAEPLEPGTYKLHFQYHIRGREMDAETVFEID